MSKPVRIDVVSDVVCPWCFIGKKRVEQALAMKPGIPVEVHFWPDFLKSYWIPLEGMSREQYLTTKFGSPEAYKDIAQRVMAAVCRRRGRRCGLPHQSPTEHPRCASPHPLGGSNWHSA